MSDLMFGREESLAVPLTDVEATQGNRRTRAFEGVSNENGAASIRPAAETATDPMKVTGLTGRVFNRILGVEESRTNTGRMRFGKTQLKEYLRSRLSLAEGEMFRSAKIGGVAEKMIEALDQDKDGKVTWPEFRGLQTQILATFAPGAESGRSLEDALRMAEQRFAQYDTSGDGSLTYEELYSGAESEIPEDTKHRTLIAQLAARLGIDVADTNERGKPVVERSITYEEWLATTRALAGL